MLLKSDSIIPIFKLHELKYLGWLPDRGGERREWVRKESREFRRESSRERKRREVAVA